MLDDGQQIGLYKSYSNDYSYTLVPGVTVLPLASDTPASGDTLPKVVRLHQPYSLRVQKFSATKKQNPPVVPGIDTSNTLLSCVVSIPLPSIGDTAGAGFDWSVSGQYVYLESYDFNDITGNNALYNHTPTTGYVAGKYPMVSQYLGENQQIYGWAYGVSFNAAAGLAGAAGALSMQIIQEQSALNASIGNYIPSGKYLWPFSQVLPKAFFDPLLASSTSL